MTTKPRGEKPSADEPPRSPPQTSVPEIRVAYQPAGRETLEAITAELVPLPGAYERASSSPEISVREGAIERDTLAAIMEEAGASFDVKRAPAPAAKAPAAKAPAAKAPAAKAPAAKAPAVKAPAPQQPAAPTPSASPADALEVFEMVTYVVRGGDVARLASERLRRQFVEEHLLKRLPIQSMADVERVDVTPWTVAGTLVVRVWCKAKTS